MHVTAAIKLPSYFWLSSITYTYTTQPFPPHHTGPPATVSFIKSNPVCGCTFSENKMQVITETNFVASFILLHSDMPKPPGEDIFILPDEYKFIPRNKRAVLMKNKHNQRLNVEMLVVVDRKMMDNHGHENITTYVLTVLNMVRAVFSIRIFVCCSSHRDLMLPSNWILVSFCENTWKL